MPSREKAKAILAAIIQVAGGSFNGKTRLYKTFYVAHLLHFRDNNGVLSDHPIVRMPRGPAIDEGDVLLGEMCTHGQLSINRRPIGPYVEDVFKLNAPPPALDAAEEASIRRAVAWIEDKTATQLSEWTHEFSNTWEDTPNGVQMNIYADLLSEFEYQALKKRQSKAKGLVDAVFAG